MTLFDVVIYIAGGFAAAVLFEAWLCSRGKDTDAFEELDNVNWLNAIFSIQGFAVAIIWFPALLVGLIFFTIILLTLTFFLIIFSPALAIVVIFLLATGQTL